MNKNTAQMTDYADLLNDLHDMQSNPIYRLRRDVLEQAEKLIVRLERDLKSLSAVQADQQPAVPAQPVAIDTMRLQELVREYGNRPVCNAVRTRGEVFQDILKLIHAAPVKADTAVPADQGAPTRTEIAQVMMRLAAIKTAPGCRAPVSESVRMLGRLGELVLAAPSSQQVTRNDVLEEAAYACELIGLERWGRYKQGDSSDRANPYVEGQSDGADQCATAIRALKTTAQQVQQAKETGK